MRVPVSFKKKQALKLSHSILSVFITLSLTLLPFLSAVLPPARVAEAALSSASVTPASLVVAATGNVTVAFTNSAVTVLPNHKFEITFPSGFDVSGNTTATSLVGIDGTATSTQGFDCAGGASPQKVCVARNGDGTATGSGTAISFVLNLIKNPTLAGTTGTFSIIHYDNAGTTVQDQNLAVAAVTITVGTLTSASVAGTSLVAGATTTYTFSFTTSIALANNERVYAIFPSGYTTTGAGGAVTDTGFGADNSISMTAAGVNLAVQLTDTSSDAAGAKTVAITGIVNPTTAGATGTFAVCTGSTALVTTNCTSASAGAFHETVTGVTGVTITFGAANKVATTAAPADFAAGSSATMTVAVQDVNSNTVTNDNATTVTFTPNLSGTITAVPTGTGDGGYGTVGGAETITVANGIASITLGDLVAETFTVTVTNGGGLTDPAVESIVVSAGTATQVVTTVVPADIASTATTTMTVAVRDVNNNTVTSNSTTTITFTPNNSGKITAVGTGTGDGSYGVAGGAETVTVAAGVASVTLADTVVQTFTVTVTNNGGLTNPAVESIVVSAGAANKVAITTAPAATIGQGGTTTLGVAVQDVNSNTVTTDNATTITFTPSLSGTIAAVPVGTGDGSYGVAGGAETVTVASGLATVTLTDAVVETFTVTITNGAALTNPSAPSIAVTGATQYVVTPSTLAPAAGVSVTVTAQLSGAGNEPVSISGRTVNWSVVTTPFGGSPAAPATPICSISITTNCFVSATSITGSNGAAQVVFKAGATRGDTHVITALDNLNMTGASATITVTNPPDAALSVVVFTSPTTTTSASIVADGTTTATAKVTLKDAAGNRISGKTVSLVSARGGTDTIANPGGVTSSTGCTTNVAPCGETTFTVKSSTVGTAIVLTASVPADTVTLSTTLAITFTSTTPAISTAAAANTSQATTAVDSGDTVTITFSAATNQFAGINTGNVDTLLALNNGHIWGGVTSASWSSSTVLVITLNAVGATVAVGDTITVGGTCNAGGTGDDATICDATGNTIATGGTISGSFGGSITGITITPPGSTAANSGQISSTGSMTVAFTTSAALVAGDRIVIIPPSGYTLGTLAITANTGLTGVTAVTTAATPTRIVVTSPVASAGAKSLTISGITNPSTASTGTFLICTGDSAYVPTATPECTAAAGTLKDAGTSATVSIIAVVAQKLTVDTISPPFTGTNFTITVRLKNNLDQAAITATNSVTVAKNSGPGTLTCTPSTASAVAGVATFSTCSINTAGTYTVIASATGLTSGVSASFVVSDPPPPAPPGGGGGGGGSTPTPAPTATATPTATTTPTATATPSPTGTPAPAPSPTVVDAPTTTQPVSSTTTGTMGVSGGATKDGGVSLSIPAGSVQTSTSMSLTQSNTAPSGATTSGGVVLPKTVDLSVGATVSKVMTMRINLTATDLAGRNINDIRGGFVEASGAVVPVPIRVVNASEGIIELDVVHTSKFTLFAVTVAGPTLTLPADGAVQTSLGAALSWTNPAGTTQYQIQVAPFNDDGPGINLIRNAETAYTVLAPNFGGTDPNFVMLPDMTYVWRVRTTTATTAPKDTDWTAWGNPRTFHTAKASSATISRVSPEAGGSVTSLTPTLTWANSDKATFYYEVQVSKDKDFGPNAFLYWELVHGGASTPANSYIVPSKYPLEAGLTYYWRVRPRIQGDGTPVSWSATYTFASP